MVVVEMRNRKESWGLLVLERFYVEDKSRWYRNFSMMAVFVVSVSQC